MTTRIGGSSFFKPSEVRSEPPKVQQKAEQPRPSSSFQSGASSFESARRAPVALNVPPPPPLRVQTPQASSLRTERLGDGQSNCLEKAALLARPGDNVVLFNDRRDGVGHAVVQHPDGTVTDPNRASQPYPSMQAWRQANPQYQSPVSVPQETLSRVLSLPPGAARDQALTQAGLSAVANRNVADGLKPGTLGELGYLTVTAQRGLNIRSSPEVNDNNRMGTIPLNTVLVIQPPPEGVKPPDDGRNWTYVHSPAIEPGGQPIEGWISAAPELVAQQGPQTSTPGAANPADTTNPVSTSSPATTVPSGTTGTPAETAAAMFTEAQSRLDPAASQWDFKCLQFIGAIAQAAGISDPALTNAQTPKDVIDTLTQEGRLHPMSEQPPPGAIVLWSAGGYYENGSYVQTGHAAIATGDASKPYITTKVSDETGVNQRDIYSLEKNKDGVWDKTPPVGWFIPANPS